MYRMARLWEIQPSEFWGMTFQEWFLEYEMRRDMADKMAGHATRAQISDWLDDAALSDEEFYRKCKDSG
jgi:hypothetical protein